jgi:bifunctional non-homologous end joining protein LigD
VKAFSQAIARHMARAMPDRFTARAAKKEREGKIYVDWLRNARGATAIAAYSTRARPGAPVSTPLFWEELSPDARPERFNVGTVPGRLAQLREDPWARYPETRQSITGSMKRRLGMG